MTTTHFLFHLITAGEATAIRAYRRGEISHLPPAAQGAAWIVLAAWTPPVPLKRP